MKGTRILEQIRTHLPEERDGRQLRRMFFDSERYVVDFDDELRKSWKQYDTDQDAHYFGVWVNTETFETLTYAEGDWTLSTSPDAASFKAELASMAEFYGDPPPAAIAIDLDGKVTEFYDERPTAEGEPL